MSKATFVCSVIKVMVFEFKVPITPKNFFHLVQFLYVIRKNAQKFLHSLETLIFYEFLKIENSALFQNTTEQQNHLK